MRIKYDKSIIGEKNMTTEENIRIVRENIEPQIKIIKNEMATVIDTRTREEGERLHKELSILPIEDLLRPFTI